MEKKKNDIYGFEEDPRFAVAVKESKTIWFFAIVGPTIQVLCAELFGRGDGNTIPLLFGFPLWIWLSFFIVPATYLSIMLYIVNTKFRKDMPLDAYLDDKAMEDFEKRGVDK